MKPLYLGFRQDHGDVGNLLESIGFRAYDHVNPLRRCGRLFGFYGRGMNTQLGLWLRPQNRLDTNFWGRVDKSVRTEAELFIPKSGRSMEYRVQQGFAKLFRNKYEVIVAQDKLLNQR